MPAQLSLAIPYHGRRWEWVRRTLLNVADDLRVAEAVIVDDCSNAADFHALQLGAANVRAKVRFEVRAERNDANLFVYRNKQRAVQLARSDWVCLLDSDNVIDPTYLDAWTVAADGRQTEEARRTVYLPEFAKPEFDYRAFAGETFTRENIAASVRPPGRLMFECLLNTMNFIVPRALFLSAMAQDQTPEPYAVDSLWINYRLLLAGARLHVTSGMQYEHTVHAQSTWRLHHHKSDDRGQQIMTQLAALT